MSLADVLAQKAQNTALANYRLQSKQIEQNRCIQHSIVSMNRSKAGYDDTSNTIFTENWTNLNNWVTPATSGVQVSGNALYSTGTGGGASGANHSYKLASTDNLRAVFNVYVPSIPASGGVIIGISEDAAGAIPSSYGNNVFGFYFGGTIQIMNNAVTSNPVEPNTYTSGNYIVTITVDQTYISLSAVKTDQSVEVCARILRSSFPVNNLFVFNSDSRALSGCSIGLCSARKGLQTLSPRTNIEGVAKTIQWTGDGTQSFRVYLPSNYDSRIPTPLAICFHGNGSDETAWSFNTNMLKVQQALVSAGFIVLTCCYNSNKYTWGNTQSTNAYYQAYLYLKNNYAISSVVFYANSMGGIESLNTLMENKIPCNAWTATSPTYNLLNNYQSGNFTPVINSAYNIASDGSNYSTQTAGRDPALMDAKTFRCVPMMILTASDDTMVSPSANGYALATAVQNTSYELQNVSGITGGHSFDVTPYTTQITNFLTKYSSF